MERQRIDYFEENVGCDYILEIRDGGDFTEIVSSMGGDVRTNRVYGENKETFEVYER